VVAQKAATIQLLSQGRFTLGLGSGENLNEHVVGEPWPSVDVRHQRLVEAVEIIRALFDGGYVNYRGTHFNADSAKLWDLPDTPPPIGIAVSGQRSCEIAGKYADVMIAVEPEPRLGEAFDAAGGSGKPRVGQVPVCFDADRDAAVKRAHSLFRWFDGGWKVNAELPGPAGFDAASSHVQPDDVAKQIPCGDDMGEFVEKIKPFADAGLRFARYSEEPSGQGGELPRGGVVDGVRGARHFGDVGIRCAFLKLTDPWHRCDSVGGAADDEHGTAHLLDSLFGKVVHRGAQCQCGRTKTGLQVAARE
jgi:alkanesulfonate monooxygenase SsuD/methylene tetrahydromethanopterin reductase-like flavin-dependent oxidoreductase (luciferase family)